MECGQEYTEGVVRCFTGGQYSWDPGDNLYFVFSEEGCLKTKAIKGPRRPMKRWRAWKKKIKKAEGYQRLERVFYFSTLINLIALSRLDLQSPMPSSLLGP